jgi:hypothetical protein
VLRLALVLLAVAVGIVSFEVWKGVRTDNAQQMLDEYIGMHHRDGVNVTFAPPMSPTGVQEDAWDMNKDGQVDFWLIRLHKMDACLVSLSITDSNYDGRPDRFETNVGDWLTGATLSDDDMDGTVDSLKFGASSSVPSSLKGPEPPPPDQAAEYYLYSDYDRDGRLDEMRMARGNKAVKKWIMLAGAWEPVDKIFSGEPRTAQVLDGYLVELNNGEPVRFFFQKDWCLVPGQDTLMRALGEVPGTPESADQLQMSGGNREEP